MKSGEKHRSLSLLITVYQFRASGLWDAFTSGLGVPPEDGIQAINWGRSSFCNKVSLQSQAFTPSSSISTSPEHHSFLLYLYCYHHWDMDSFHGTSSGSFFIVFLTPVSFTFWFILHSALGVFFFYKQCATPSFKNLLCSLFTLIIKLLCKVWAIPRPTG